MDKQQAALVELGRLLKHSGYRFVTPTPGTHARVNARPANVTARSTEDVFGWSRPFRPGTLAPPLLDLLDAAGAVEMRDGTMRSLVRFSSLGTSLFVHSSFPTDAADSVFFGPDTYRFCGAVEAQLRPDFMPETIIDVGAGSGAGGLHAAALLPHTARVLLTDINAHALRLCEVNAGINNVTVAETRASDVLVNVTERAELIVCNPPYLVDRARRTYRHGGGRWGFDLSLRIAEEALGLLTPDGKFILYTGAPVVGGRDLFREAVWPLLKRKAAFWRYEEIDPDVFGEELDAPPYDKADRIAAVLLVVNASDLRT